MTSIKVDKPFLPDTIEMTTEVRLGDASIRQSGGVSLNLSWKPPDGGERGTKLFICERCMVGTTGSYHDKECLFAILQRVHTSD